MSDAVSHAADHAARSADADPGIRTLTMGDLRQSLLKGYDDFRATPTQLIFVGLLYPVIAFVAARAAVDDLLPLLFPLLTGISLMGPVVAVGLYEISRRREAGLPVSWMTAFEVLRSPAIGSIVFMAVALLVIFALWVFTAQAIYTATMGSAVASGMGDFARSVLHTPGGHRLIVLGNVTGAVFAAAVLAISVVSLPMLLDRNCSVAMAVRTSIRVVARNPVVMAAWGVLVAALLVAGSIPAFVGLALVMPILGHATWHLYRRSVG